MPDGNSLAGRFDWLAAMDMTTTVPCGADNNRSPAPSSTRVDHTALFYFELPQLDVADAAQLAEAVYPEVEFRVGTRISERCSDDELDAFGALMEAGDDERCARWLDEHVPDHTAIATAEMEAIIAETVATIDRTDAERGGEQRLRRARTIDKVDSAFLGRILDLQRREYVAVEAGLKFLHDRESRDTITFLLSVSDGGMFCLNSNSPSNFPPHRYPDLLAFVDRWNADHYLPKAHTIEVADAAAYGIVAEFAVPIAPGIHGQLVDHFVDVGVQTTCRMFDALPEIAANWRPSLL